MGLACILMVVASSPGRDRMITGIYALITTVVGLAFVAAGRTRRRPAPVSPEVEPELEVE
jgi:hypothetical protein